jgi:hypothetical protein
MSATADRGWYNPVTNSQPESTQDKRSRVQQWLLAEGWRTTDGVPEQGWAWMLAVTNTKTTLLITQPANKPDQIIIQGEVEVTDDHRKSFNALPSEKRDNIIWDLRFDLLKMGVEFFGVHLPFESIFMRKVIYSDGLTKDNFMQRVREVHRAVLFVQWTFSRNYKEPPNEEPEDGFFVN